MTILDELAAYARVRTEKAKEIISPEVMKEKALALARQDMAAAAEEGSNAIAGNNTVAGSDIIVGNNVAAGSDILVGNNAEAGNDIGVGCSAAVGKNASVSKAFRFEKALSGPEIAFICEVKKASPSKGLIAPDFPYVEIAREYEAAGAECISVLTEPKWFLGSGEYLKEITAAVQTPCIRKDFTVDEYMIYEAKTLGASAVLLICSLLDTKTLERYIQIADSLGLSSLVEAHDEEEIRSAVASGARMIGVNNRNLKNFTVDVHNSERLRKLVPDNILFVAESGIRNAGDVRAMKEAGANACLVGETLMRSADKAAKLKELRC